MSKLVLSMDDKRLAEITIDKDVMTIGRRKDSDIVIEDKAASGRHSKLVTLLNDSFIEDLGSTNGTYVNGEPIKKHALNDKDVVTIGKHVLKYVHEESGTNVEKTVLNSNEPRLQILNGPNTGAQISLTKRLTTIGKPGTQVGAITHRSNGFYFLNIDSDESTITPPMLNGSPVETRALPLKTHDVIELAGIKMEFISE